MKIKVKTKIVGTEESFSVESVFFIFTVLICPEMNYVCLPNP